MRPAAATSTLWDGYEILNDDVEWREEYRTQNPDYPDTMTIIISQSLPKDKVTMQKAELSFKTQWEDSSTTRLMDVELQAPNTSPSCFDNVVLTEDGIATWDAIPAAGRYEARVYRTMAVGAVMTKSAPIHAPDARHAEGLNTALSR